MVSRYIPNPLLINGYKFDLRIYVLLTSIDPLRLYVYNEGLTRFASEKYRLSDCKTNRFAHLTNYSVNKKNEKYVQNTSASEDSRGNKWSLSGLFKHLQTIGVDCDLLWSKIYDVIIKSFSAVEGLVGQAVKKLSCHRCNCFEVFGFDVLVDSELKPWLIEVNLTPSLACESPLDFKIKSSLIADTFTLIGLQAFDRRKDGIYSRQKAVSSFPGLREAPRHTLPVGEAEECDAISNSLVFQRLKVG